MRQVTTEVASGPIVGQTWQRRNGVWTQQPVPDATQSQDRSKGLFGWDGDVCEAVEAFAKKDGQWHRVYARNVAPAPPIVNYESVWEGAWDTGKPVVNVTLNPVTGASDLTHWQIKQGAVGAPKAYTDLTQKFEFGGSTQLVFQCRVIDKYGAMSEWTAPAPINPAARPPAPTPDLTAPATPVLQSAVNDYYGITVGFTGVATATDYEVQLLTSGYGVVASLRNTSGQVRFDASTDSSYIVRVRAFRGAEAGPWSGELRWRVGHPQQTAQVERVGTATRPWSGDSGQQRAFRDGGAFVNVPANVQINRMDFLGGSSVPPMATASRAVFWVAYGNNAIQWPVGTPNGYHQDFTVHPPIAGWYGVRIAGNGWSTGSLAYPYCDLRVSVYGTETYTYIYYETVVTVAEEYGRYW
jgi:hypothetical protein